MSQYFVLKYFCIIGAYYCYFCFTYAVGHCILFKLKKAYSSHLCEQMQRSDIRMQGQDGVMSPKCHMIKFHVADVISADICPPRYKTVCRRNPLARGVKVWLNWWPVIGMQEAGFHTRRGGARACGGDVPGLPTAALWVAAPVWWNRADGERTPRSCMSSSPSLAEGDIWHHLARTH